MLIAYKTLNFGIKYQSFPSQTIKFQQLRGLKILSRTYSPNFLKHPQQIRLYPIGGHSRLSEFKQLKIKDLLVLSKYNETFHPAVLARFHAEEVKASWQALHVQLVKIVAFGSLHVDVFYDSTGLVGNGHSGGLFLG